MASKFHKLHEKTIFDFTDDQDLIEEIIVVDKETYLKEVKNNPIINAYHLIEYAERVKDDGLRSAVYSQYRDELAAAHNE